MAKMTEELTASVLLNYSMEDLKLKHNITEERIIRFLTDNVKMPKVEQFLLEYYSRFNIKDDKVLIITDTHLGGMYGDYNLLSIVYNYALRRGIKYIIHCGDIIEGSVNRNLVSPKEEVQLEELVKKYPRISGITTYYLLGNHDYPVDGKVMKAMNSIDGNICLGPLKSYVLFNDNYRFYIHHSEQYCITIPTYEYDLRFQGHGHNYYVRESDKEIGVPALCYGPNKDMGNTGFLVLSKEDREYLLEKYNFKQNYQPILKSEKRLTLTKKEK